MEPYVRRAICIIILAYLLEYYFTFYVKAPRITDITVSKGWINRVLKDNLYEYLRMPEHTFYELVVWLAQNTSVGTPRRRRARRHKPDILLDEKVAIFIAITGHAWSYREIAATFGHSLETVSR